MGVICFYIIANDLEQCGQPGCCHRLFPVSCISHGATFPDNNVHGANIGPIWGRQDPGEPYVGPKKLAIWDDIGLLLSLIITHRALVSECWNMRFLVLCNKRPLDMYLSKVVALPFFGFREQYLDITAGIVGQFSGCYRLNSFSGDKATFGVIWWLQKWGLLNQSPPFF